MAALVSVAAHAEQYRLPFVETQDGVIRIPFVENEWTLGSDRDDWSLYIEKGMLEKHQNIHEFHAVTAYRVPYFSEALKTKISKIYTYGALNCREGNLYILFEWYASPEEILVHRSTYEFGAYTVELLTPNTTRNEVYNQICKDKIGRAHV